MNWTFLARWNPWPKLAMAKAQHEADRRTIDRLRVEKEAFRASQYRLWYQLMAANKGCQRLRRRLDREVVRRKHLVTLLEQKQQIVDRYMVEQGIRLAREANDERCAP